MKIKKGKLNYDQSGRAYPDNPRVKENWDSIWEYQGKYYKLVGDDEHKEWDEIYHWEAAFDCGKIRSGYFFDEAKLYNK